VGGFGTWEAPSRAPGVDGGEILRQALQEDTQLVWMRGDAQELTEIRIEELGEGRVEEWTDGSRLPRGVRSRGGEDKRTLPGRHSDGGRCRGCRRSDASMGGARHGRTLQPRGDTETGICGGNPRGHG